MPTNWIDRILFGLEFGIGFACAQAVLAFVVSILSAGVHH